MIVKHRGYDEEHKKFVYGYYTKLIEGIRKFDCIITDDINGLTRFYINNQETINPSICQCDRNGIEIYNDDIIEWINAQGLDDGIGKIVWNNKESCFYVENEKHNIYEPIYNVIDECSIIGNDYENSNYLD